jgi:hypothetical protein
MYSEREDFEIEAHYGITHVEITIDGDAPGRAFVKVEAISQEIADNFWRQLAETVSRTEWWE